MWKYAVSEGNRHSFRICLANETVSLAKHIRKLWRFPSDKVILELVILLSITQGSFLLNLSMRWLALMRRCARRVREFDRHCKVSFLLPFFFWQFLFFFQFLALRDRWTWLTKWPVVLDRERIVIRYLMYLAHRKTYVIRQPRSL